MRPLLDTLPAEQRRFWPELSQIPEHFVLYGGTAVGLRLGGRQSVDFDFFTNQHVSANALSRSLAFLNGAELIQSEPNTATFTVDRGGPIKVSFFGGLIIGRVGQPDCCEDNHVYIASLLDLAAQKMKVILDRAEAKDYYDIYTLLNAGVTLPEALGATKALYPEFNPVLSLKALAYYGEPSLATLPTGVREYLTEECAKVESVKVIPRIALSIGPSKSIRQTRTKSRGKGSGI
ncbi:MAG TPA: nucleotidyl transferase AbiEii/AbiGii toxin family protein [Verrucomicrobiae bacterium]|nr:nucleotidyl transferase AbiEii/AbiGii toxin family protein [Verrucomicrobiae bacterium]